MGTRSFLAIKKQRKSKCATEKSSDSSKSNQDSNALEYIRKNFLVWQYTQYDGFFQGIGVEVWTFLHKFINEWTDEQRVDYINSLDMIEEASEEFVDTAENWYSEEKDKYFDSWSDTDRQYDFENEIQKTKKELFLEYVPCTVLCGSKIFDIIATQKGKVKTAFTSPTFPLDGIFCEYGYIVDFDKSELHVLHNKKGLQCQLLDPLEQIYGRRGIGMVKTFKFVEFPETKEKFLNILDAYVQDLTSD